jgi:O-antigen/teichoic acid export membrane protein
VGSEDLLGIAEKATRGGIFLFVGNALATVILALGSIIIARLLGPSNYGLYILAMVMPALFVNLADAGVNLALVRIPAMFRSRGDYSASSRAIRLGFLCKLTLSIGSFLVCYFGADIITTTILNRPDLATYLQFAGLLIVFQALFDGASNAFIGLDLMQYSAGMQVLYSVLKSVLAPLLILLGFGILGAITGYLAGILVAAALGAGILFAKYARISDNVSSVHAVSLTMLLDYSLPLYGALLLTAFLSQYQNLVLAHLATNVQIGNFNAAWNFSMLLSILVYPISTAIFPMFSKMSLEKQKNDISRGFMLAVKYASLILIPASVGVMVFSRDLVDLTYGSGYMLSPQYLTILAALYLLTGLGLNVIGGFLNGVAATRIVLMISVLTLGVYFPLGPALTWIWGPPGLLVAYITSNAISTLYGVHKISSTFGAHPDLGASARILAASVIAAVPSLAFGQFYLLGTGVGNFVVGGCLYLFVYLTVAPILGAVSSQDIKNLTILLRKTRAVTILMNPILAYETRILSALGHVA